MFNGVSAYAAIAEWPQNNSQNQFTTSIFADQDEKNLFVRRGCIIIDSNDDDDKRILIIKQNDNKIEE